MWVTHILDFTTSHCGTYGMRPADFQLGDCNGLQRTATDSVIYSCGAFYSMSVMHRPLHPLVLLLRSVINRLSHRWSRLIWVPVFDLTVKGGPTRSLELPTASLAPCRPLHHDKNRSSKVRP